MNILQLNCIYIFYNYFMFSLNGAEGNAAKLPAEELWDKLVAECQKQVEPKKRASGKSNWKEWSEKKKEGPPAGEGGGAEKEPEKAEKPRMKKGPVKDNWSKKWCRLVFSLKEPEMGEVLKMCPASNLLSW